MHTTHLFAVVQLLTAIALPSPVGTPIDVLIGLCVMGGRVPTNPSVFSGLWDAESAYLSGWRCSILMCVYVFMCVCVCVCVCFLVFGTLKERTCRDGDAPY